MRDEDQSVLPDEYRHWHLHGIQNWCGLSHSLLYKSSDLAQQESIRFETCYLQKTNDHLITQHHWPPLLISTQESRPLATLLLGISRISAI